uniref:Transposase n=1 Tax=Mesocestoides corti TaxID=53468 RepID=A0A5K3FS30_MESCO
MGLAHSFTKRHRAKPKEFSLDAFVVDLVKGMAEATVDSVIKERRWTLNAPRCLGGDVGVTNGFSRVSLKILRCRSSVKSHFYRQL